MEKQLVVFELAHELFGVEIAQVEGIIKLQKITPMPNLPDYIEGIINLRGSILPVIDLRKRFALESGSTSNDTRIVVIRMENLSMGMIVDAVSEVLTIDETQLEPVPDILCSVDSKFVIGIANLDNRLVIILSLVAILTGKEKWHLMEASSELAQPV
jgi:purine-binding chemotaxis protein CheW